MKICHQLVGHQHKASLANRDRRWRVFKSVKATGGLNYSCTIGPGSPASTITPFVRSTPRGQHTKKGQFTVVTPPAISSVAVAEAVLQNRKLNLKEKLVITWVAASANGIAAQTVTVDATSSAPSRPRRRQQVHLRDRRLEGRRSQLHDSFHRLDRRQRHEDGQVHRGQPPDGRRRDAAAGLAAMLTLANSTRRRRRVRRLESQLAARSKRSWPA